MAATVTGILLTGVHGSRPSSGVSAGTLYSCTTHSLIYQTSDTGSTWATWATLGGGGSGTLTTVKDQGSNLSTAVVSLDFVGAGVTATGTTAVTVTVPDPPQATPAPTTFTGDTIDGSSATPFADVAAFDTKEVLNSRVLHLKTLGASKDQRVRVTLGTTKAGAFDVTTRVSAMGHYWSSMFDSYLEVRLSTSADAQIAIARIGQSHVAVTSGDNLLFDDVRVGGSSISGEDANSAFHAPKASAYTFRFVRDGSNVITFFVGVGAYPLGLAPPLLLADNTVFTATVSGTLARVEYAIHTPSGPGSTAQWNAWIDYLASV